MAIINCPECKQTVSDSAKTCPHCGFSISAATNDLIRIKVDNDPQCPGYTVSIKEVGTNRLLASVRSGSVAEIKSKTDLTIYFCGMTGLPMLTTTVSPKNGGKYRAAWGAGFFSPKIVSCSRVDVIDS